MDDEKSKPYKEITLKLITDNNISNKSLMSGDEIAEALGKLTHIRLDRLHITRIENLDCLGPVTNMYLQQNYIEKIENLEALGNLRFLTLAGNKINKVENLKHLRRLKFLDLSFNCIENFSADELPLSLMILSLKGNPCAKKEDYRSQITEVLTNLKELDEIPVNLVDDEENVHSSDEGKLVNEEEEDTDDLGEATSIKEFSDDIISRLKIRSTKQAERHSDRMAQLNLPG